MDSLFKALLTAGTVLLVMVAARHGGRRFAGVVAALPTITAPTLAWLADEEGIAFAISAAVGSVAVCGMLAVFALVYARAARYSGGAVALACGLFGALAIALPAEAASANLTCALALALASSAIAFAADARFARGCRVEKGIVALDVCCRGDFGRRHRLRSVRRPVDGRLCHRPPVVAAACHRAGGHGRTRHPRAPRRHTLPARLCRWAVRQGGVRRRVRPARPSPGRRHGAFTGVLLCLCHVDLAIAATAPAGSRWPSAGMTR